MTGVTGIRADVVLAGHATSVCHSQQSRPVPSRQLRTPPKCTRPAWSVPSQVTIPPDLALGAGVGWSRPCIGLAVAGRPIGPRSLRTGAPEAFATRRDRAELNQGEDFPARDRSP